MKVNIEIEDDSKFLEALAQEMTEQPQVLSSGDEAGTADAGLELSRARPQSFSCVAFSCIGNK